MHSIFLSHSSKDKSFARRLARDLEARGLRVWIDEAEMLPGDSLIRSQEQAIQSTDYLGVILSPNSVLSEWVQREVEVALVEEIRGRRLKVIPILYGSCEVPGFLATKVWADFSTPRSYRKGLDVLVRRFTGELMRASVPNWVNLAAARSDASPREWTPKAVRLGLEYKLLQETAGRIQLADSYINHMCDEAQALVMSHFTTFEDEGWIPLHIHAAGKAKAVQAYEDDFVYFVSEASGVPLARYLMEVGRSAGIFTVSESVFTPAEELVNEFLEAAERSLSAGDIREQAEANAFAIRCLQRLVYARLLLSLPQKRNHAYLLGLFLYAAYGFHLILKGVLADLSHDSEDRKAKL